MNWINKNSKPFFQTCSSLCHRQEHACARNKFSKTCQNWKRATRRFLSQRNSSSNSWTDRFFLPDARQWKTSGTRSFSRKRIPYFPYLVSIPIEMLFAHSPFPDKYNRTVDVWHFDAVIHRCSLQRGKRKRKKKKEENNTGREIRSVSVPLSLFPYETTMRLSAVAWRRGLRPSRVCQAYQQFRTIRFWLETCVRAHARGKDMKRLELKG